MYSNGGIYIPDRKPPMGARRNPYLPINQGLAGLWLFNQGSGNKVFDLSGNGGDGTISGFTWGAGKYGSCLQHTGANNQAVVLPSSYKPLDGLSAFSVRFIGRPNTVTVDFGMFYTDRHGGGEPFSLWFDNAAADKIAVLVTCSGGTTGADYGSEAIVGGNYYDIFVTYKDGEDVRLYVNGVEDTGFSGAGASGTLIATGTQYYIGNNSDLNNDFEGSFELASIYNRALSASEIALLYREPFCGFRWTSIIELASYVAAGAGSPLLQMNHFGGGTAA